MQEIAVVTIERKQELCRRERKALDREEEYYEIAYCSSREGMKTLAFSYLGQGTQEISNIFRFCEQKHLALVLSVFILPMAA